ncbi:XRE family transcriptional regulator [Oxalobacteraceae bacterium CAVE-383]|nr:XRE family transcriptional regulator [Oxalobacteraceae bacterium CAVE-383]
MDKNAIAVSFGLVLRDLRKDAGLSQEQLGFEAGLQRNYISELELGQKQPSVTTLFKLSKALKVKPEKFAKLIANNLSTNQPQS